MKRFSRIRPLFLKFKTWLIFGISSILCLVIAIYLMDYVFPRKIQEPIIGRSQALEIAKTIAQENHLNPEIFQQAISFKIDKKEESFLELEYGPHKMFNIINKNLYKPYTWIIRHFQPASKQLDPIIDTTIKLTPDGKPYGFHKKIYASSSRHKKVSMQQAQLLAEKSAAKQWSINFNEYQLIKSTRLRTKKSSLSKDWFHLQDYNFVYKVRNVTANNIPFQLKLEVTENALSGVDHIIDISEPFITKYDTILNYARMLSRCAMLLVFLLFFIGGCIGLYLLRKTGWIIWKPAKRLARVLVAMTIFQYINRFPLKWIDYDIFTNESNIYFSATIGIIFASLFTWLFYMLIIAAGETFTRKAFPTHIQFWQTWSRNVAASPQIMRRTLAGYFIMPFHLLYVVIWYLFTIQYFSWWVSADPLIEPNIALHVPFISNAIMSLCAGISEECLFRAIPLAGAALWGERYGRRNLFIGIAFVLQVILFGAAHASYPSQPLYARIAELVAPASMLGITYLFFGLYSAIIAHFTFDLFCFTFSDVGGSWWHQLLILSIGLIPLIIILYQRLRRGSWNTAPTNAYNVAWQPKNKIVPSP